MCKLKVIPENYIVENRREPSVFKESSECTMMSEVGIILVKADNKDSLLKLIKKLYGRDNMKIRYVDATMYIDTDYFKDGSMEYCFKCGKRKYAYDLSSELCPSCDKELDESHNPFEDFNL